jgi:hypothetical protein
MIHSMNLSSKRLLLTCLALFVICTSNSLAQSLDPSAPSPIRANTLSGRIAARDLGDARLTDHYYSFAGVPGDLIITVQSRNLNGDIDVFTAGTLRPLLKLTLYAESTSPVTKSLYLRRREDLILRVEARSPNDDEGTYQLSFSGSFEAIPGGPEIAESEVTAPTTETPLTGQPGKTRRVSSVGARIEEPVKEVAAAPTPEPTPAATPESKPGEGEAAEKPKPTNRPGTSSRTARARRPAPRRTATEPGQPNEAAATAKESSEPTKEKTDEVSSESKPKPPNRAAGRRSTPRAEKSTPTEPNPEPAPDAGQHLILETKDGTMINRPMSGVKRVMVENGQVVVVGKDGSVDRFLLSNVLRLSIAP